MIKYSHDFLHSSFSIYFRFIFYYAHILLPCTKCEFQGPSTSVLPVSLISQASSQTSPYTHLNLNLHLTRSLHVSYGYLSYSSTALVDTDLLNMYNTHTSIIHNTLYNTVPLLINGFSSMPHTGFYSNIKGFP